MVVNGMVWITITIMDVNKKCQKKIEDFKINLCWLGWMELQN